MGRKLYGGLPSRDPQRSSQGQTYWLTLRKHHAGELWKTPGVRPFSRTPPALQGRWESPAVPSATAAAPHQQAGHTWQSDQRWRVGVAGPREFLRVSPWLYL